MREFGIPDYDAGVLVSDKGVSDFFEAAAALSPNPKAVSNWIMTEMLRLLSEREIEISEAKITPEALAALVALVDDRTINSTTAKEVFVVLFDKGGDPDDMVEKQGLKQMSDTGAIEELVLKAIEENPKSVTDYRNGKKAAAKYLVGQVMRLSKGKADPQVVSRLIEDRLNSKAS